MQKDPVDLDMDGVVEELRKLSADSTRYLIAIAGAPGAGKSTFAEELRFKLHSDSAVVVPMDGFHYDNNVLDQRGLRARKGAPETFDYEGLEVLLKRIQQADADVAFPVFDRGADLSRAGAGILTQETKFVIVEGNYLLLDELPWARASSYFDLTIFIDVPRDELYARLEKRWIDHGLSLGDAQRRAAGNDMVNADHILSSSRDADVSVTTGVGGQARFRKVTPGLIQPRVKPARDIHR